MADEQLELESLKRYEEGKPKISVIVPCYNREAFIQECVVSIMSNDYMRRGELIIVDDGSTDSSAQKISSLVDMYTADGYTIRSIKHDTNRGVSAARNTGISDSLADIVVCIDADDIVPPNFLRKNYQNMYSNKVDVSYTEVQCFGSEITKHAWPEFSLDHLRRENYIPCSAMMRKDVWVKAAGFDETMKSGLEDYDFWLNAAHFATTKFKKCNETILLWRKHDGNTTAAADQETTRKEILKYLKDKHKGWYLGNGELS